MKLQVTPVFDFIYSNYLKYKDKVDKIGFILEGSSGSSKTVSIIQFLLLYSQYNKMKKITCGRAKMTWTIPSIWNDTNEYFQKYNQSYTENKSKYILTHNTNKFRFVGADDPQKFHGVRQDVFWFNEAMELSQSSFDQVDMRTNDLYFLDFNPSNRTHWIFEKQLKNMKKHGIGEMKIVKQVDEQEKQMTTAIFYLRSTFRMNRFLPSGQRLKILGYQPTPENIKNGTADDYKWKVYGLGERCAPEGLVFKYWKKVKKLPENIDFIKMFGVDWGGNDPHTLTECNFNVKEKLLYIKCHIYQSELLNSEMIKICRKVNITNEPTVCDSARKDKIKELQYAGINALGSTKGEGSIIDGIDKMREFKIFLIDDNTPESDMLIDEFSNYKYPKDDKTGKLLNVPEDKNNHCVDGIRYATRYFYKNYMF